MPTSFTLKIDTGAAMRVGQDVAFRLVTDTTRRVLNRAIALTPVRTGNLRGQNKSRVRREGSGKAVGEVFNDTVYAAAVHDGTRAHVVRPKPQMITVRPRNATVLRFVVGGRVVYAKQVRMQKPLRFVVGGKVVYAAYVNMPARRGKPWLLRALKEVALPEGYRIVA